MRLERVFVGFFTVLRRRGIGYWGYLLWGYTFPKAAYHLLSGPLRLRPERVVWWLLFGLALLLLAALSVSFGPLVAAVSVLGLAVALLLVIVAKREFSLVRRRRRARELTRQAHALYSPDRFVSWSQLTVEPGPREAVEAARGSHPDGDVVIGSVTRDGRVVSPFGELPGFSPLHDPRDPPAARFTVDLVLVGDTVLARKDFCGDRSSFVGEWLTLALLSGKANVPAIHHVDERRCVLYKEALRGTAAAEILASQSAEALGAGPVGAVRFPAQDRAHSRATLQAQPHLSEDLLCELENQLELIHSHGVTGINHEFENIVIDATGTPWFVNLDGTRVNDSTSALRFAHTRDLDRQTFNRRYGRDLLTEASARSLLQELRAKLPENYRNYAPIDFGNGLSIGEFYITDSGTGRWEFFNKKVVAPHVVGKRVVDLGSNNGSMSLMMLRAGAREVVGLEISSGIADWARLNHKIFEWRDMRRYNFQVNVDNMLEFCSRDWGEFDVVTSFCSLYYLDPDGMARVVRKASLMGAVMIIQTNTAYSAGIGEEARKATIPFLRELLQNNGFPQVDIHSYPNFARPILVGRTPGHV